LPRSKHVWNVRAKKLARKTTEIQCVLKSGRESTKTEIWAAKVATVRTTLRTKYENYYLSKNMKQVRFGCFCYEKVCTTINQQNSANKKM
jgi:hypothetical protein